MKFILIFGLLIFVITASPVPQDRLDEYILEDLELDNEDILEEIVSENVEISTIPEEPVENITPETHMVESIANAPSVEEIQTNTPVEPQTDVLIEILTTTTKAEVSLADEKKVDLQTDPPVVEAQTDTPVGLQTDALVDLQTDTPVDLQTDTPVEPLTVAPIQNVKTTTFTSIYTTPTTATTTTTTAISTTFTSTITPNTTTTTTATAISTTFTPTTTTTLAITSISTTSSTTTEAISTMINTTTTEQTNPIDKQPLKQTTKSNSNSGNSTKASIICYIMMLLIIFNLMK